MPIIIDVPGLAGKSYLDLCVEVREEVMASGNGPVSVLNQTGEYRRIVKYVADADEEIQQEHDEWKFMVNLFTLTTVVGVASYAPSQCDVPVNDLRQWRQRTFKCYLESVGPGDEQPLTYIDYQIWYDRYHTGTQSNQRPVHFTIGNGMEILLGPVPGDVYKVSGEYQRCVTRMTDNDDVPTYPAEYHMLPIYLAMMKYGRSTAASEVFADGQRLYNKLLNRMRRTQLPPINTLRPLA